MDERAAELKALQRGLARDVDGHFEALVVRFQQPLFAFAFGMLACRQDAEEVVQDSFVRAYRALSQYESDRIRSLALQAWLYRICLNLTRNRRRRVRVQTEEFAENGRLPRDTANADPTGSEYERVEEADEVRAHVASLPEKYRAAIILRYSMDLPYGEIAQALGSPEGTVKSNVHRGLAALQAAMHRQLQLGENDTSSTRTQP